MPKTKSDRSRRVGEKLPSRDPGDYDLVTGAAPKMGISKQTLSYAIARGEITVYRTASGRELIYLPDIEEWNKFKEHRKREHMPDEWKQKFFKTVSKTELKKYKKLHGLD